MFLTPGSRASRKRVTAANLRIRRTLSSNMTLHVSTTGNDTTGDGSLAKPFATPTAAQSYVSDQFDLNGKTVVIQMADGTYPSIFLSGHATPGVILFQGNTANAAAVVIDSTVSPTGIPLQNQRHQVPVIGLGTMTLHGQTVIDLSEAPINFWFWFGAHIIFDMPGSGDPNIFFWGPSIVNDFAGGGIDLNYTGAGQRCFIDMDFSAMVNLAHIKNITGAPVWSDAFVKLSGGSTFEFDNAGPIAGGATGKKFILQSGSTIVTHGTGFDIFPGDAVGDPFNGWYST